MSLLEKINELESEAKSINSKLDDISKEIREIEKILQSSNFPTISIKITQNDQVIKWDVEKRRLIAIEHDVEKPLIECKAYLRIDIYPFLESFIDKIIDIARNK